MKKNSTVITANIMLMCISILIVIPLFSGCSNNITDNNIEEASETTDIEYNPTDDENNIIDADDNTSIPKDHIIAAFFGLDNALPEMRAVCQGSSGMDGLIVNFKYPIDVSTLSPADIEVIDSLGNRNMPMCTLLFPAAEKGENRSILTIGEFGTHESNPPKEVRVVGDLFTLTDDPEQSSCSTVENIKGASIKTVVPLHEGPKMFFAQKIEGSITECPSDTAQVIQVAWEGGITPISSNMSESDLFQYYTVYTDDTGTLVPHVPVSLADTNDFDNYHQLCLNFTNSVVKLTFQESIVEDPNHDPNPYSEISVTYCKD